VADLGAFGDVGPMLLPLLGAIVLMSVGQLDTAYDSSALAAHVLTGVSGTADRAGRALGLIVLFGPLLTVTAVVTTAISGRWELLPASLGATLGTAALVIGAGSAISPWMPGQTPAPEASPFGTGSSGGAQALLGALLMLLVILTAGAPAIGTAIAAAWFPWLGWVSLAIGLGLGALAIWLGVRLGGRALDRRWPEVLAAVTREH
jgi:ABC-2 type transport system permease protein